MTKDKTQNDDNGSKLKRKEYEKELRKLQAELCHLQAWVKHKGLRIIVLFEGRDGAGKGGTIRAITERVSPRVFRLVALPAPSDREKTQMYIQRYMAHFPAAGEIVIFDRSWYNRAGVEHVMGFCTKEQYDALSRTGPDFRRIYHEARDHPDQVLARGEQRGAGTAVRGPRRGSVAPVEAQSHGLAVTREVVRLLPRTGPDAGGHGHEACAVVHRAVGRQEARAPQLHHSFAVADSVQNAAG